MKNTLLLLALALLPFQALVAQAKYEYKETVPANGAKRGKIALEMPAGVLQVKATSASLAEANVSYSLKSWKPELMRNTSNQVTEIKLKQGESSTNNNNKDGAENKWNLNFSKNLPLELDIDMGAGESKLDLRNSKVEKLKMDAGAVSINLDLRDSQLKDLELNAGVGEANIDLRGDWNHDLTIDITGGIGDVNLKLPKNTGVKLKTSGMGSRELAGLTKEGSYYRNKALGKSKNTLVINVTGGLGSLHVTEE